jgi:hypothetical protein
MPFLPAPPPSNMPSGKEIFERAEAVWHSQSLPPYIVFTTFIAEISTQPVRVSLRTSDGKAFVETIPDIPAEEPIAYPGVQLSGPEHAPLGICVSQARCMGVIGIDPFGPEPILGLPPQLRTIAKARVFADPYQVTSAQYMDFDGTPVYDLKLSAPQDPVRYRIRELVVDAQTYHVWKLMYEEPLNPNRLLTYGFGPVSGIWYLRQTCDAVPIRMSGLAVPACTPDVAMMWDYDFPTDVPDWFFDRTQYIQHAKAAARKPVT